MTFSHHVSLSLLNERVNLMAAFVLWFLVDRIVEHGLKLTKIALNYCLI